MEKKMYFDNLFVLLRKCEGGKVAIKIIMASILNSIIDLSGPIALALITDSLIKKSNTLPALIIMTISLLGGILVNYFRQKTYDGSTVYFTSKLKNLLNYKLYKLNIGDVEQIKTGDMLNLYSSDVRKVSQWAGAPLANFLELNFYIIGAISFIMYKNFEVAIILIPIVILLAPLLTKISSSITTYSKKERLYSDEFISQTYDLLSSPEMVRAWSISEQIENLTSMKLDLLYKTRYKKSRIVAFNNATSFIISYLPGFITLFIGVYFCFNGEISIGFTLALIQMMMGRFAYIFPKFNKFILDTRDTIVSAHRIELFLNKTEYHCETSNHDTSALINNGNDIIFENVTLKYPDGTMGIKNISFNIKSGERICFAGMSGSGKSSAIKAALLYYTNKENISGNIFIKDKNINDMKIDDIYDSFSPVFQENHLFDGSISENMGGISNLQNCNILMNKLGLESLMPNSQVGENGSKVSGGQRQRIAIGRGIVKDAPIYVFDEPTSALDEQTETEILDSILKLTKGKTSIFVSHRKAIFKHCHRILFFKDGCIIEEGSHEDLVLKNGMYAKMLKSEDGIV